MDNILDTFKLGRFILSFFVIGILITAIGSRSESYIDSASPASYIVQGESVDTAAAAVESVGGTVTHELGIINAVGA